MQRIYYYWTEIYDACNTRKTYVHTNRKCTHKWWGKRAISTFLLGDIWLLSCVCSMRKIPRKFRNARKKNHFQCPFWNTNSLNSVLSVFFSLSLSAPFPLSFFHKLADFALNSCVLSYTHTAYKYNFGWYCELMKFLTHQIIWTRWFHRRSCVWVCMCINSVIPDACGVVRWNEHETQPVVYYVEAIVHWNASMGSTYETMLSSNFPNKAHTHTRTLSNHPPPDELFFLLPKWPEYC